MKTNKYKLDDFGMLTHATPRVKYKNRIRILKKYKKIKKLKNTHIPLLECAETSLEKLQRKFIQQQITVFAIVLSYKDPLPLSLSLSN